MILQTVPFLSTGMRLVPVLFVRMAPIERDVFILTLTGGQRKLGWISGGVEDFDAPTRVAGRRPSHAVSAHANQDKRLPAVLLSAIQAKRRA